MPERTVVRLTPPPESLGQAIRRFRLAADLEQEAVREIVNKDRDKKDQISQSSMSNYELDKIVPSRDKIDAIGVVINAPAGTLWAIYKKHRDWKEAQPTISAPADVIFPSSPAIQTFLMRIKDWDDDDILALEKRVEQGPPDLTDFKERPTG